MKYYNKLILLIPIALLWCGCAHRVAPPPASRQITQPTSDTRALDHFIRGVVLDQQGDPTRAIAEYRRALRYDSSSASIYIALAEDYFALKLYDDASLQLDQALRVDSANVQALEFLCDLMIQSELYDSAIALTGKLIELHPEEVRYRRNLASIYLGMDRPADAILQYEEIMQRNPEDGQTLGQISALYISLKDFQKALESSLALFALDSTDDRVCFTIASLMAELDRPAEADSYFARAIKLNPDDPRYFSNWAYLYMNKKDYPQAISILQKGTAHHPLAADIWALLGSAYERDGQDSSAMKALDHSLELDASQVGPYITLGYIYDERGEFEKALEVYNQALSIAPEDPLLLNNYAYLLAQRGVRLEEALEKVSLALKQNPDNPSYLDTMGWVYYGLKEYSHAREFIEKALEKDAENPTILDHLGDIFRALGDVQSARKVWLKALEKDGNNVQIREKLAQ